MNAYHAASENKLEMSACRALWIRKGFENDRDLRVREQRGIEVCQTVGVFCAWPQVGDFPGCSPVLFLFNVKDRAL